MEKNNIAVPDAAALVQTELEKEGNKICAECCTSNPTYVSLSLGVFVCVKCEHFHKKLPVGYNNVVSIRSQNWAARQISFIQSKGNVVVNEEYEKCIPLYYHRPNSNDPPILREQFIKAKYEREEFKHTSSQTAYNQGSKTGSLFKRGKDNEKFMRRKFVLKEPEGTLQYFIKYSDRSPKDSIMIRNIVNVYMVPDKVGSDNGMQITYEKDGIRRNLFLFGETAKDTSDWYHSLRASMVQHKFQKFPDHEMKRYLNTMIILEGWMSKTGPKRQEKFRKRWFSLVGTMIWYYANPLDAHPLGCIPLGSKTLGYGVMKGTSQAVKVDGYGLTIHTPGRVYILNCPDLPAREKWVHCIKEVIDSCTVVWSKANTNKASNQPKYVANKEKTNLADSSSKIGSVIKKPSTNLSNDIAQESEKTTLSKHVPLFEKNNNRSRVSKKSKAKQTSVKRKRASTTKVSANKEEEQAVEEGEEEMMQSKMIDKKCENEVMIRNTYSKKYSDDSEDISDRDEEISHASGGKTSPDTEPDSDDDDVITLLQANYEDDLGSVSKLENINPEAGLASQRDENLEPKTKQNFSKTNLDVMEVFDKRTSLNISVKMPPNKPPRQHLTQQEIMPGSTLSGTSFISDLSSTALYDDSHNDSKMELASAKSASYLSSEHYDLPKTHEEDLSVKNELSADNIISLPLSNETTDWRKDTFNSIRRVDGHQRKSLKKKESVRTATVSSNLSSPSRNDMKDVKPRPIDITLHNQIDESLWFIAFQSEEFPDPVESYVSPWVGAQIAENPASVGPIRLPSDFEIAVIDKAPGGFGLLRTTGPFYAESGDVWEVDIPADDGSAPEMYYHEGMETEDGSIMLYGNIDNVKKFEVAVFKSGRKLFSRRGVKPGEAVNIQIKQAIHFLSIDQEMFYELEGQDIRASEYLPKATCIDLNYRSFRMKVLARKRGRKVYFTNDRLIPINRIQSA